MKWRKLGKVFEPDNIHPWMKTHAANPVAELLYDDLFRIYFSCRDEKNVSSIGFVDVDLNNPFIILRISETPVLGPGERGGFDDSGTSLGCIIQYKNNRYLYYLGWNLGVTVPWRNSIGLAIYCQKEERFIKTSKAPILDRNDIDPYSLAYPFVLRDGGIFKMWYGSNLAWGKGNSEWEYVIKYAESTDGVNWIRDGIVALNFKDENEYALARPHVLKESGIYKMWFTHRGESYKIGYAESIDGIHWDRNDDIVGIDVSDSGWDSEIICYPCIFDHKGQRYMLYNGNGYGKSGFGLAVLQVA